MYLPLYRYKDGQLISSGNENMTSYTINSVEVSDSGYYFCLASNELSTVTSKVAWLQVEGKKAQVVETLQYFNGPLIKLQVYICICPEYNITGTSSDFCTVVPSGNTVDLPEGCRYNGQSTVDRGHCDSLACHTGDASTDEVCEEPTR